MGIFFFVIFNITFRFFGISSITSSIVIFSISKGSNVEAKHLDCLELCFVPHLRESDCVSHLEEVEFHNWEESIEGGLEIEVGDSHSNHEGSDGGKDVSGVMVWSEQEVHDWAVFD